jgi:hypothetical protein
MSIRAVVAAALIIIIIIAAPALAEPENTNLPNYHENDFQKDRLRFSLPVASPVTRQWTS